jgi:hypothetical protein
MSVEHSPEHHIAYHFVAYDAEGRQRPGRRGPAGEQLVAAARQDQPTDVFLFSHGWNADPSGAIAQYGRWVDTMATRTGDRERRRARDGSFRPLLASVHWPSKAWADEDLASLSYAVGGTPASAERPADPVTRLVDRYAEPLGDSPTVRDAVRTIVESSLEDAAPATLPVNVADAYRQIDASLGNAQGGEGAAPGDDREPFDPEQTYQAALLVDITDPVPFGALSLGGVLAPLRVLSFWTMKSRARAFGESGGAELLRHLREAAPDARLHLMGHSFGCIVASAAIAGPPGGPDPGTRVDTLVLVQGAMSLWSYCSEIPGQPGVPGYFHSIVRDRLVSGPTVVTTSVHDRAVRVFYPIGAGARGDVDFGSPRKLPVYGGIGTFGLRGPGIEIEDESLERVDEHYRFQPGVVHNLDADRVITKMTGLMGAHSDICHSELARVVWRAAER